MKQCGALTKQNTWPISPFLQLLGRISLGFVDVETTDAVLRTRTTAASTLSLRTSWAGSLFPVHIHLLRLADALGLAPLDKVVNDAGPRTILVPKGQRVIVHALKGKLENHIPHVAIHRARPLLGEEGLPERKPVSMLILPWYAGRGKEHVPVD